MSKTANAAVDASAAKPRVLVVDDIEDNRDLLTRRLNRKGFNASSAEDGESALELLDKEQFDIVLLDWMMPGMSGLEVLEKIRAKFGKTELPVLMATAKAESDNVVEALQIGANDYVTKPIDFPVLLARLQVQLSMKEEATAKANAVIDLSSDMGTGVIVDNRYELSDKIGEGGFAAVYRAKQLSTGQTVAFKVLLPHRVRRSRGDLELKRFLIEMKIIGDLDHTHIVRLIDSGQIDVRGDSPGVGSSNSARKTVADTPDRSRSGSRPSSEGDPEERTSVPYIVMEYLKGETLAMLFARDGLMAPERIVDLLLPVLNALQVAHDKGIVHRDVKPHNIFLVKSARGVVEPKVLDFGIAKITEPEMDGITKTDSFLGTPEYMAPEQGRGWKDIDGRADIFSVGAIAYEAVTGRKLYKAESFFAMVHAVASADFDAPSDAGADLPMGLETVLLTALAKNRDDRYQNCEGFGRALIRYASKRGRRRWADAFASNDLVSLDGDMAPDPPPSWDEAPTQSSDGKVQYDTLDSEGAPQASQNHEPVEIVIVNAGELPDTRPEGAKLRRRSKDSPVPVVIFVVVILVLAAAWLFAR
jgi:serine/threonine protein kinase/CheY-like chemotaxis protein